MFSTRVPVVDIGDAPVSLLSPEHTRMVGMSEFQQEIEIRLESATRSLAEAQSEGDDYLVSIRLGEIESLQRLAEESAV